MLHQFNDTQNAYARWAARYLWWQSVDESMQMPRRILAQVMCLGDFDDAREMQNLISREALKDVLRDATIGQFDERSWHYWHHRLDLAEGGEVPPLPSNRFPVTKA